jgi:hypothetical protein
MNGRRVVAAGVVVAAVTVGGVAGALIASPSRSGAASSPEVSTSATANSTPEKGDHDRGFHVRGAGAGPEVLDAGAKALGLSTEDLLKKLSDGKTTIADVAKAQNVDVQKVIDAMEAASNKAIEDLVNNPFPAPHFGKGDHDGPGRFGGPDGFGFIGGLKDSADALAKSLGITSDELFKELGDGKSIADIAKANNVDVNTIIDSLVKDATDRIDAAVKDGHLSEEQAAGIKTDLKDTITKFVNNGFEFGGKGMHGGFGFGFGGPGGPGGPDRGPHGLGSDSTTTVPAPA